jgi:hypothetical protein
VPQPPTVITRDPKTPHEVDPTRPPRAPATDPALGVAVEVDRTGTPRHRLVTIGDSLTHGFQSGAIFNTRLSYPALIARELGWFDGFRHPTYEGYGGLPFNIEYLLRELELEFGSKVSWWELGPALFRVRQLMARIEDWWERGPGRSPPKLEGINHNLAVYGWDLRDVLSRTAEVCRAEIDAATDALFRQLVENANERAALRVLPTSPDPENLTPLGAARTLGEDGGIETLIVLLGANNALGAVTSLRVRWTEDNDDYKDLKKKRHFNVWRPSHFRSELALVVEQVKAITARHVIWGTVPHVTIAPIARGVGDKVRPGSRYFPFYTYPWISDDEFDEKSDPRITENEARDIDAAIDLYNDAIQAAVAQARTEGLDWYLFDVAGLLDRLASRRYLLDEQARPPWWTEYELPDELKALDPRPDSRFLSVDASGRRDAGGLFSLDGVHPTTIGYGIMAQELIRIMELAGVAFFRRDGGRRDPPVRVDFRELIRQDSLIADTPAQLTSDLKLIGWLDEKADVFKRLLRVGSG